MICMGVNDDVFDPAAHTVISNASCTTNCLAPMAKVLHERFGIEQGLINTVHAYTSDQQLQDQAAATRTGKPDLRRMRAAALSIIPNTTGAARAIGLVHARAQGQARRHVAARPDADRFDHRPRRRAVDRGAASTRSTPRSPRPPTTRRYRGVLEYSDEPLVSADIVGNPSSCIFSAVDTMANGKLVKVLGWYDNEWGYSNRLVDLVEFHRQRSSTRCDVDPVPQLEDLPLPTGTRVLVRADFNVPLRDGVDRRRPAHHGRAAHDRVAARAGRRGRRAARTSAGRRASPTRSTRWRRSRARLGELLGARGSARAQVVGPSVGAVRREHRRPADVMLLENLRFEPGETKQRPGVRRPTLVDGSATSTSNDAFGAAHRAHASIVGPPRVLPQRAAAGCSHREVEVLGAAARRCRSSRSSRCSAARR